MADTITLKNGTEVSLDEFYTWSKLKQLMSVLGHSDQTRAKMSVAATGRKMSPDAIAKTASKRKGVKLNIDPEVLSVRNQKIGQANKLSYERLTLQQKEARAAKQIGKVISNETRALVRRATLNQARGTCEHCSKELKVSHLKQWHGDKCKSKPTT